MTKIQQINQLHGQLKQHKLYQSLDSLESLQVFMKWHVFAVWDFMSLLKSLQCEITSVKVPWTPSPYPKELVRFINEIVLGEESDEDGKGSYVDHFSMYRDAMSELNADLSAFDYFIKDMDFSLLPDEIREFVRFNIDLSMSKDYCSVASAFFYGRENLIPDIFDPIVSIIDGHRLKVEPLRYYLKRHIELDGDEHGALASKCLEILCDSDDVVAILMILLGLF